ncbi:DnaJ-like protein subfamily C member 9 [Dinothrombium tinctorium]|uniref:DnaJ-like protein subfamily C member 9 n=1 Tax=Dinothrombium tinctorium TaxID=1965070 RepID=A0A443QUB9_9ACAR|nr:DnaJ-like protein subfamily C member 9 [Dinothrombium tinctorium]
MGFGEDCEQYFATRNLYEILEVERDASEAAIKKAFRKLSLKHHPDRFQDADESQKADITRRFQVLAKAHFVLNDKEKRAIYDETGIVVDEDTFGDDVDWMDYWRVLFPRITIKDIESFFAKYIDSEEEKQDLITIYNRFKGNMDLIAESMIGFDEQRTRQMIETLIANKEVPEFDAFTKEPESKRLKRKKRFDKEAKEAEKEAAKESAQMNDLVRAIQLKNKSNFDDLVSRLEDKYAKRHYEKKDKKVPKSTIKKQRK